ncbi:putative RTA1 domain protein [Xylogone sp. PMI_703]|nr:putative RTA1 domain protein [Xylogone sp. PMI_703]
MAENTPFLYPNLTDVSQCTINLCNIKEGTVTYIPTLFGNALYAGIFGAVLIAQAGFMVYYRTWTYSIAMICGSTLEVIGYIARVYMHMNVWESNPFLIYLITLTIAPVFYTAAIYITLSRIIVRYGTQYSRLTPKTISITFMTGDFISLVLQAAGGALADTADTEADKNTGVHIMVAGLAFQVFSIGVFITVAADFFLKVYSRKRSTRLSLASTPGSEYGLIRDSRSGRSYKKSDLSFRLFLFSIAFATLLILIRSAFRVVELVDGFDGALANNEVCLMVLEGAMISLSAILLTVFHPGHAFKGKWSDAGWDKKPRKTRNGGKTEYTGEDIEMM